jgi:N-acetylglucosaminyl-diphospho-decaprenol L-rhamnosyltransferase
VRSRSLILVNYRSAQLTRRAIESARAASSAPLQVVVVDNSCDSTETAALAECGADHVILSERNLGYGAAINRGRRASYGEVLIVSNPDVEFGPGSIDRLAEAVNGRVVITGPRLTWDAAGEWLLPPADELTPGGIAGAALAGRADAWRRRHDAAGVRARIAFWTAQEPITVRALSGAVLAIDAQAFDHLGGFDERYFLYFEEHDFTRRARNAGGIIRHIPAAICRHLYNQSAASSDTAAAHYAESEARYIRQWFGERFASLMRRIARPLPPLGPDAPPTGAVIGFDEDPAHVVIEASPLASFATAAGHFPRSRTVHFPKEVWAAYRDAVLYLRAVRRSDGRTLRVWRREKG